MPTQVDQDVVELLKKIIGHIGPVEFDKAVEAALNETVNGTQPTEEREKVWL